MQIGITNGLKAQHAAKRNGNLEMQTKFSEIMTEASYVDKCDSTVFEYLFLFLVCKLFVLRKKLFPNPNPDLFVPPW